jgi:hypothetical protein
MLSQDLFSWHSGMLSLRRKAALPLAVAASVNAASGAGALLSILPHRSCTTLRRWQNNIPCWIQARASSSSVVASFSSCSVVASFCSLDFSCIGGILTRYPVIIVGEDCLGHPASTTLSVSRIFTLVNAC